MASAESKHYSYNSIPSPGTIEYLEYFSALQIPPQSTLQEVQVFLSKTPIIESIAGMIYKHQNMPLALSQIGSGIISVDSRVANGFRDHKSGWVRGAVDPNGLLMLDTRSSITEVSISDEEYHHQHIMHSVTIPLTEDNKLDTRFLVRADTAMQRRAYKYHKKEVDGFLVEGFEAEPVYTLESSSYYPGEYTSVSVMGPRTPIPEELRRSHNPGDFWLPFQQGAFELARFLRHQQQPLKTLQET